MLLRTLLGSFPGGLSHLLCPGRSMNAGGEALAVQGENRERFVHHRSSETLTERWRWGLAPARARARAGMSGHEQDGSPDPFSFCGEETEGCLVRMLHGLRISERKSGWYGVRREVTGIPSMQANFLENLPRL